VALGNLAPSVEIMPAYSTTPPARVLEKEPVRVPSLAMPRLAIDRNGSIKLILPFQGEESLARKLSDAIYYLFFYNPIPSYFPSEIRERTVSTTSMSKTSIAKKSMQRSTS
jgi:hypothetical protein